MKVELTITEFGRYIYDLIENLSAYSFIRYSSNLNRSKEDAILLKESCDTMSKLLRKLIKEYDKRIMVKSKIDGISGGDISPELIEEHLTMVKKKEKLLKRGVS